MIRKYCSCARPSPSKASKLTCLECGCRIDGDRYAKPTAPMRIDRSHGGDVHFEGTIDETGKITTKRIDPPKRTVGSRMHASAMASHADVMRKFISDMMPPGHRYVAAEQAAVDKALELSAEEMNTRFGTDPSYRMLTPLQRALQPLRQAGFDLVDFVDHNGNVLSVQIEIPESAATLAHAKATLEKGDLRRIKVDMSPNRYLQKAAQMALQRGKR